MALTKISTGMLKADAASVDLNIDAGTLFLDVANNRVGVANTSPSVSLHVSGGAGSTILNDSTSWSYLRLKSPNANGGYIQFADADDDDVGQIFYYHGSGGDYMSFTTGAAERMRINSSGNVGIGTTNPQAALHAVGNILSSGTVQIFPSAAGAASVQMQRQGQGTAWSLAQGNTTTDMFEILRGASSYFAVNSSGNVGIGTTTPGRKLSVETTGTAIVSSFKRSEAANAFISFLDSSTSSDSAVGVGAAGDTLFFRASNVEHARLNNTGLGIGTTSPAQKLHVEGDSRISSSGFTRIQVNSTRTGATDNIGGLEFMQSGTLKGQIFGSVDGQIKFAVNGSTEAARIDSGGRLLINTTTSIDNFAKLQIVGDSSGYARLTLQDVDGTNQKTYFQQSGGGTAIITQNGTSNGFFDINGWNGSATTQFFRIGSTGKVGIGTTNPDATLRIDNESGLAFKVTGGAVGNAMARFVRDVGGSATVDISGSGGDPQIIFTSTGNSFAAGVNGSRFEIADHTTLGTNARLVIDTAGQVGIGTTGPDRKLHLYGTGGTVAVKAEAGDTSQASLDLKNSNSWFRLIAASGTLSVYDQANTTERFRISSAGYVGIGTAAPERSLHVKSASAIVSAKFETANTAGHLLTLTSASTGASHAGAYNGLRFYNGDGFNMAITHITESSGDGYIQIGNNWSGGNQALAVHSAGNVGIGTTAPDSKLTIYNAATGITGLVKLWTNTSNNTAADGGAIEWIGSGDKTAVGAKIAATRVESGGKMDLRFYTGRNSDSNHEKMRILANGNIGINTTAPTQGLQLASKNIYMQAGSILMSQGTALFMNASNGGIRHGFHSTGYGFEGTNVGIGTTAPLTKLHVVGTATDARLLIEADSDAVGGEAKLQFKTDSQDADTRIKAAIIFKRDDPGTRGTGDLHFAVEGNNSDTNASTSHTRLMIQSDGNIGIGTTSPSTAKLVVQGADASDVLHLHGLTGTNTRGLKISLSNEGATNQVVNYDSMQANGIHVFKTAGTERMRIHDGGNVGIGTTDPDAPIHVQTIHEIATIIQGSSNNGTHFVVRNSDATTGRKAIINLAPANNVTGAYVGAEAMEDFSTTANRTADLFFSTRKDGTLAERVRIDSSGNVGIGTASPGHLLDILNAGSGDATIKIKSTTGGDPTLLFDSAAANRSAVIRFMDQGSFVAGRIQYVHNGDRMDFQAGSSTGASMSILNGKVGIGTTAPRQTLDIRGGHSSTVNEAISFGRTDDNYRYNSIFSYNTSGGNAYLSFKIHDGGSSTTQTETMVLKPGKVGIGEGSPAFKLQLGADNQGLGAVTTNKQILLNIDGGFSTTNSKQYKVAGFVGTTSGGTDDIFGSTYTSGEQLKNFYLGIVSDLGYFNADRFSIVQGGSERLIIKQDGSVTINGTSPFVVGGTARLSIYDSSVILSAGLSSSDMFYIRKQGTAAFAWQTYNGNNGGQIELQPYGGNVGIGTTSPSEKLEVNAGNIRINNATGGSYFKAVQTTNGANAGYYMASGSSNWYTLVDTSGRYQIYDGDAAAIRVLVDGSGNVGIGLSNPSEKLELSGTNATIRLGGMRLSNPDSGRIGFNRNPADGSATTSSLRRFQINGPSATHGDYLDFQSYNSSGVYQGSLVLQDGKLGIGTTSPSQKLHIKGDGNESVRAILVPGTTPGNVGALQVGRTGGDSTPYVTDAVTGGVPIAGIAGLLFGSTNVSIPAVGIQTPNSSAGHIVFKPKGVEKVRIQANGGISFNGDTAAANALDDYEEGTFTPTYTVAGGGSAGTVTSTNVGTYTKVGRVVTVAVTSHYVPTSGTAPTSYSMTLPFAVGLLGGQSGNGSGQEVSQTGVSVFISVSNNATTAVIKATNGAAPPANSYFNFSFTYQIA